MKHLHPFIVFLLTTSLYAQTSEIIFSDVDFFGNSMAIHGDELYFPTETHIQKIDLTQTDPSAVQVLEVVAGNLVFHGNDLYFNTGSTISKIDVTDQSPAAVDVVTSFRGFGFLTHSMNISCIFLYVQFFNICSGLLHHQCSLCGFSKSKLFDCQ